MKREIVLLFALIITSTGIIATDLSEVILEPIPEWVNLRHFKYHQPFNIRLLASKEHLTLREAVEVQNHYYDMLDDKNNQDSHAKKFTQALNRVKGSRHKYEDVWNGDVIARAKFIVVFDLDDTLLCQYYKIGNKGPEYWDLKLDSAKYNLIKFTPNWQQAISRIKELGGAVVFFTAKRDSRAQLIWEKWIFTKNIHISKVIDGFLTKNHLTLVPGKKYERGRAFPMKDLKIIDPSLQRVILIDDSPSKTYQPLNVRFFHKYNPDIHLADNTPSEIKTFYENLLPEVVSEIEETLKYMNTHSHITFVQAYRPYSLMGRVTLNSMIESGLPKSKAMKIIREMPTLIEDRF